MAAAGPTFSLFFSYSHDDEALRDALAKHLALLVRQGHLLTWHDRQIDAGQEWAGEIDQRLENAEIILLLVSSSFLSSDYCYELEMSRALERHAAGDAIVIPIILRPCDWQSAPFASLQGLPKDGRPVTSWDDLDEAFLDITKGIRKLLRPGPAESTYTSDVTRDLSRQLEGAYEQRAEILATGGDAMRINETIVGLKRKLREGPQLEAGDFLLDGRFKLLETLGRGGFATVWKAYDRERQRLAAVKVLHSQYSKDKSRRDRFFRGARQMANLRHPGIVSVVETECEDGGYHFFAMEYLAGGDFRQTVLDGSLSREERLRVVLAIGEALSYAHSQGVIHRDVKPANILLDLEGRAKLTDFDLVRAADTTGGTRTAMMGTIVYAAPEAMLDGKQAAEPADVYGLGMTALFALHGKDLGVDVLYDPGPLIDSLPLSAKGRDAFRRSVARDSSQRWPQIELFCSELSAAELSTSEPGTWSSHKRKELNRRATDSPELDGDAALLQALTKPKIWKPARMANALAELPARCRAAQEKTGIDLVYVPSGTYPIGDDDSSRKVDLDGFWIGKHPVTNEQYRRFVESGHREPRSWDSERFNALGQPVVGVSWNDAMAYASWAGFVLPSEEQWEAAARGPEGRIYPWGTEEPTSKLADFGKSYSNDRPAPVGSYPRGAGPFGAEDQAGGVWEWCVDELAGGQYRPLRGGSWNGDGVNLRSAFRSRFWPNFRRGDFGFRVSCTPPSLGS